MKEGSLLGLSLWHSASEVLVEKVLASTKIEYSDGMSVLNRKRQGCLVI